MRRRLVALSLLVVGALLTVGLLVAVGPSSSKPGASPSQSSRPSPSPTPYIAAPVTVRDFALPATTGKEPKVARPTHHRLWFAEGSWWAILPAPSDRSQRIFRLDPSGRVWQDTGTVVDPRSGVVVDAVWDGKHVSVVSAGTGVSPGQAVRFTRLSYAPKVTRFLRDPDFPIPLALVGSPYALIARDSRGVAWVAMVAGQQIVLRHTLGDDGHWSPAQPPPGVETTSPKTDALALASIGGQGVGLVWADTPTHTIRFALHRDADSATTWSVETAARSSDVAGAGLDLAGDRTGRAVIAADLAPSASQNQGLAPGVVVLQRSLAGTWSTVVVTRSRDRTSQPRLVVDDADGQLLVAMTANSSHSIVLKRSGLERPVFDTGEGTPAISSSTDPDVDNPSVPAGPVDGASGLVILAFDPISLHYLHAIQALSELPNPSPVPSGSTPPLPLSLPPVPQALIDDTFDLWHAGDPAPPSWIVRSAAPREVSVIGAGLSGRAVHIQTATSASVVRICRAFDPIATGRLQATLAVRLGSVGTSDATIAMIRTAGGAATADVRMADDGLFAYEAAGVKVRTAVHWRARTWYMVHVVVDVARGRYTWDVRDRAGHLIAGVAGAAWRVRGAPPLDEVCVQSSSGRPGLGLDIDSVLVQR